MSTGVPYRIVFKMPLITGTAGVAHKSLDRGLRVVRVALRERIKFGIGWIVELSPKTLRRFPGHESRNLLAVLNLYVNINS